MNIIRQRMPTFDDNFLSRSETQIQNQLYRRSMGLPPRLGQRPGFLGPMYQSLTNLPTLNEVNEQPRSHEGVVRSPENGGILQ